MEHALRHARRRLLVALDAASLLIAMVLAMTIHTALRPHIPSLKSPPAFELYLLLAYLTLPMWLVVAGALGLYRHLERPIGPAALFVELLRLHVFGLLGLTLLVYLTQIPMNRSVVGLFLVLTFGLMYLSRLVLYWWIRRDYRAGHGQQRVLLVADSPRSAERIIETFRSVPFPPSLVGCLAARPLRGDVSGWGLPVIGTSDDIVRALHENAIDVVLVSCSRDVLVDIDALLAACDDVGVPLRCHLRVEHQGQHTARVVDDFGVPAITFDLRRRSADALLVKRALDIVASAVGLVVLSPLLVSVAACIWGTMGAPVLFRQLRTGYNGRTFTMYKFRTMVRDAERRRQELNPLNEIDGPAFKMQADPRITPLGRLLRQTSLDELPQLFNVLAGHMSLVGPRPLPVAEQQQIGGAQRRRLSMRPGITGLWQVSGRSDLSFAQWMELDLAYVDNWSLLLDMRLLLKTVPAVLAGRGAK